MAEPLLSEGTDLTRLIARIRAEHGDSATIIYHDSVRRGGVLGFFAREVHRVAYRLDDVVDEDAPDGVRRAASDEPAPSTAIDELIGEADSADGPTRPGSTLALSGDQHDDFAAILRQSLAAGEPAIDDVAPSTASAPVAPAPAKAAPSAPSWFDTVEFPALATVPPLGDIKKRPPHQQSTQQQSTQSPPTQQPPTQQPPTQQPPTQQPPNQQPPNQQPPTQSPPKQRQSTQGPGAALRHTGQGGIAQDRTEQRRAARRHVAEAARLIAKSAEASAATWPSSPGLASVTPIQTISARSRLDLLLELRQLGVPTDLSPAGHAHDLYQAVEEVLAELPSAPELPRAAGEVVALVGPLTPALATAASLAAQLRIPESEIWIAGLAGHPAGRLIAGSWTRSISGIGEARLLRSDLRTAPGPSLIVIATDTIDASPDDPWAAELVAALEPTATWLLMDATSKAEDAQRVLDGIPGVDALAVHSVRATTSPATVWDIGLPIALIDGRRADTFAWSTVLFGALRSTRRHRASA